MNVGSAGGDVAGENHAHLVMDTIVHTSTVSLSSTAFADLSYAAKWLRNINRAGML